MPAERLDDPATSPNGRGRRVLRSVAGTFLVVALLGGWPVGAADAGCAGPQLSVGPVREPAPVPTTPVLTVGSVVAVSGEWFHTGCDDTGQGAGCGAPPSEQAPMRGVELVLEQGASSTLLGTADAAEQEDRYRISWQVRVPATFQPGPATLLAGGASVPVELRAG